MGETHEQTKTLALVELYSRERNSNLKKKEITLLKCDLYYAEKGTIEQG